MPGPDDTKNFLKKLAEGKGYIWPEELDSEALNALKREAEALRQAQRGLGVLMELYLTPQEKQLTCHSQRSPRAIVSDEETARFSTPHGTQ